ncbi:hypothetical protein AOLI_G00198640 [Acnodon oligacanthus]
MERSGAVLIALTCVLLSRISGAQVEMRVRPGDNAVLYSDCVWQIGETVWFRNSSNEHQPPHMISLDDLVQGAFSCHAFVWNHSNQTQDLLVKNVTESDLGLYYCARRGTKHSGAGVLEEVYYYGNRTTRLSLLVLITDMTPPAPPVSDCSVCWTLLVSVCPVCVLLSSTCVYCIYRYTTKGEKNDHEWANRNKEDQKRTTYDEAGGDDIIYAPLDIMSRGQKRLEKNRVQRSDICVLFSRISGAEVEMRVRPGDNVVLYSDCVLETGLVVWFRNSSNESQSPLIMSGDTFMLAAFSRYSFVWNPSSKTRDLLVKNVTKSDLGLYYCAHKLIKFIKDGTGADVWTDVYLYGNRTTRLSFLGKISLQTCGFCS